MPRITFDRTGLLRTSLGLLPTLAALILLAVVLAYWSWVWFLPRAKTRGDELAAPLSSSATVANLFGVLQRAGGSAPATGIAIKLQGVVAAGREANSSVDHRGYAILQLDAKKIVAVHEGEEIMPGVSLIEVHADHLILERGGLRETLAWPPKNANTPPAPVNAPANR